MKTIEFKTVSGEVKTAIVSTRIDENLFSCKSSNSKRKDDLFIHISMILSDVSDIAINDCEFSDDEGYSKTDEFEGLCQANQIGENPFKSTMLINR
jgi:hypothetical protein